MSDFVLKLLINFLLFVSLGSCYEYETQFDVVASPQKSYPQSLESPQWSEQENALYWVSNMGPKKLFRMDGETGEITSRKICEYYKEYMRNVLAHQPGFVVVAVRSSLYLLDWESSEGESALRLLTTVDVGKPDNTINDGKADAAGRLFFGTTGKIDFALPSLALPDQGTMYSIDASSFHQAVIQKRPVSISNGIAWSLDDKKMYYNDSPKRRIVAFDYDLDKGTIANETTVFSLNDYRLPGIVDGLTIDQDGNLWLATFTSKVIQIDPTDGTILKEIDLPVDQVTSMMWGGPRLEELYVTTAAPANVMHPKQLSGALLVLKSLGTAGVPEHQFVFPDALNY